MRSTPALTLHSNMWNGMTARSYIISYSFDYFAWGRLTLCVRHFLPDLRYHFVEMKLSYVLQSQNHFVFGYLKMSLNWIYAVRNSIYICLIENPKIMWCMAFKWRNMDIIIANVHLGEPQNAQFTIHCDSHNHSH